MLKPLKLLSAVIMALALWLPSDEAFAQTVLGRSVVDGRSFELLSDQTWRYSDSDAAAGCTVFDLGLSFCDADSPWQRTDFESSEVAAQYRVDDRHYSQFVIEGLGALDGFTPEFMRRAVVDNAAAAAGGDATAVAVLDVSDETVDSIPGETIIYHTVIDGLNVVYFNTVIILDAITYQLISFSINRDITERHIELHDDLIARLRIDGAG